MKAKLLSAIGLFLLFSGITFATTYYVAPGGNDNNPGTQLSPFATIQKGANVAVAGDTVNIKPGTYVGAKFGTSGTAVLPITFHAEPGAIVTSPGSLNTNHDNLWIRDASYVILDGFESHSAPRSGIAVQAEPDDEALGIVLKNNNCHNNTRWGIFTAYAKGILIQNNQTSYSGIEHGIYVSNSSDDPVITGNVSHHNHASGIQINADPALPGDGIISNAIMDSNIIYENGSGGGSAINLASVISSRISNNLLYDNHAGGIAGWDDGFDPAFGTHNNSFLNNTIVQANDGRFAISLLNGSKNNKIKNNILIHPGTRGSINVDSSSEPGLDSDYNIVVNVFSYNDGDTFVNLSTWQSRGHDAHSIVSSSAALFVSPATDDYHSLNTSVAIDAGTTVVGVPVDLDGVPRPQNSIYDAGCYEFLAACSGDTTDPSVSITAPADTSTVSGSISIDADAMDNCAVMKVDFYVDGSLINTDSSSPYSILWSTNSVPNGLHTLTAKAFDTSNLQTTSDAVQINVNNVSIFSDDFEDNDASDWNFTRGNWSVVNGNLTANINGKGDAISPAFGGCTNCTIEADVRVDTPGSRISVLGWYQNKKTLLEVRLMSDRNKILVKQKSNGSVVAKSSAPFGISTGTVYRVKVVSNGTQFQILVDGVPILNLNSGASPSGVVGFRVKSTVGAANGSFAEIVVY
jgi:parallel beta-helix repeat protein